MDRQHIAVFAAAGCLLAVVAGAVAGLVSALIVTSAATYMLERCIR